MLEVRGIILRSSAGVILLSLFCLLVIAGPWAQASEISPNGIAYLSTANTLTAGGTYNITVQILYGGGPLKSEGIRVYFLSNDTSIIPVEMGTFALTDKNGVASYTITPIKPGNAKLTTMAMSSNSGISADKNYQVIEGAVISPTATATPSPTPAANATATATATAVPSAQPTLTATPTIAPTSTAVPTSTPPAGNADAQAIGIITASLVVAVILIVLVLITRVLRKK